MRNVPTIVRREVNAYFFSPLAYIVLFVFLGLTGAFFQYLLWSSGDVGVTTTAMFGVMSYTMMLISPLITMRLLAEEARSGTLETMACTDLVDGME